MLGIAQYALVLFTLYIQIHKMFMVLQFIKIQRNQKLSWSWLRNGNCRSWIYSFLNIMTIRNLHYFFLKALPNNPGIRSVELKKILQKIFVAQTLHSEVKITYINK